MPPAGNLFVADAVATFVATNVRLDAAPVGNVAAVAESGAERRIEASVRVSDAGSQAGLTLPPLAQATLHFDQRLVEP